VSLRNGTRVPDALDRTGEGLFFCLRSLGRTTLFAATFSDGRREDKAEQRSAYTRYNEVSYGGKTKAKKDA
jgi:hypothetical protein